MKSPEDFQSWHLVIHQLPARPIYLRAKIARRLSRLGALGLKNSVYVLPRRAENLGALRDLVEATRKAGGEAYVCEAAFIEGIAPEELVRRFREDSAADYEALAAEIRDAEATLGRRDGIRPPGPELAGRLTRLKKRFARIEAIDFFGAPGREKSEALLAGVAKRLEADLPRRDRRPDALPRLRRRIWVTRRGIQVDRIASAWLIRRFLDPEARFRFIDPKDPRRADELRFDMVDGDFTHVGDSCTFEVLLDVIRRPEPALRQLAEIVHDIDLKDGKFRRADAAGIQQVLLGILTACPRDDERLKRGFALFDDLYASFRKSFSPAKEVPR